MARRKGKLFDLYAPSSKRRASKSNDRLFPKFLVWILAAIIIAGIVANILQVYKHHW